MFAMESCPQCRFQNLKGFRFCSNCGRPVNPQAVEGKYKVTLAIHDEADLQEVLEEIFQNSQINIELGFMPTIEDFRKASEGLDNDLLQSLIRRYNLHIAKSQNIRTYESIRKERGGTREAARTAVRTARLHLWWALVSESGNRSNQGKATGEVQRQETVGVGHNKLVNATR